MNAIYNATYNGVSLDGASLYVYGLPICLECAKGVIQVGIKAVYMPEYSVVPSVWEYSTKYSKQMFKEAGVEYNTVKGCTI
jgi:dCMP deaminase